MSGAKSKPAAWLAPKRSAAPHPEGKAPGGRSGSEDHQDGWVGAERGGSGDHPPWKGDPWPPVETWKATLYPPAARRGSPKCGNPAYHISHETTAHSEIPGTPVGGVQTTGESRPLHHRDHATFPLCADA